MRARRAPRRRSASCVQSLRSFAPHEPLAIVRPSASIAAASCSICLRESWRDLPGWNSWLSPTSSIVMSSSSRLNESTGTLTAPKRSSGSISWPSMTARSRMAWACARISRVIASRSSATRSASASVRSWARAGRSAATAGARSPRARATLAANETECGTWRTPADQQAPRPRDVARGGRRRRCPAISGSGSN